MKIRFYNIVLGWTVFAFAITMLMYAVHPYGNSDFQFLSELRWESAFSLVWIPATPLVLMLSRKFSFAADNRYRNIFIIMCIGVILAIVLCFGHALLVHVLSGLQNPFTSNEVLTSFYYNIDKMLIVFTVLVIFQQALTYYDAVQQKELKASQLQSQLSQAQMVALKMQLQPHFLFNTLNAIVTLVHKNPDTAEEMIVRLSDFLRMTLDSSGKHTVTLKEEMEFIRAYLAIEHIRFDGKLTFTHTVPDHLLEAMVPLLILQPVVENAVKHGISRYEHAHAIDITVSEKDSALHIIVRDDGIPVAMIDTTPTPLGVGLSNIRRRLESMYGQEASLTVGTNDDYGYRVAIRLPIIPNTNGH